MIDVTNIVKIYEIDGVNTVIPIPAITISSHWNYHERINITTPSGEQYTVLSKDLLAAILNAGNTAAF